jgi:hypothetical protein
VSLTCAHSVRECPPSGYARRTPHRRGEGRVFTINQVDLDALAETVGSREEFARFLQALVADLQRELARPTQETAWGAGDWANADLEGFLETWSAWLEGLTPQSPQWPSYGVALESLEPTAWRLFAEMLLVARVHE